MTRFCPKVEEGGELLLQLLEEPAVVVMVGREGMTLQGFWLMYLQANSG